MRPNNEFQEANFFLLIYEIHIYIFSLNNREVQFFLPCQEKEIKKLKNCEASLETLNLYNPIFFTYIFY